MKRSCTWLQYYEHMRDKGSEKYIHLLHERSTSGKSSKFEVSSILFTSIGMAAGRSL